MLRALDLVEQDRCHLGEAPLLSHGLRAAFDPRTDEERSTTEALGGCGFPLHDATMTSAAIPGNVATTKAVGVG